MSAFQCRPSVDNSGSSQAIHRTLIAAHKAFIITLAHTQLLQRRLRSAPGRDLDQILTRLATIERAGWDLAHHHQTLDQLVGGSTSAASGDRDEPAADGAETRRRPPPEIPVSSGTGGKPDALAMATSRPPARTMTGLRPVAFPRSSQAMDEQVSADRKRRGFERFLFFTDAVVAIAVTLLILPVVDAVTQTSGQGMAVTDLLAESQCQILLSPELCRHHPVPG